MIRCYLYAPVTTDTGRRSLYDRIRKTLDRPDVLLAANIDGTVRGSIGLDSTDEAPALERVDAFVLEGTEADTEIGFLLAHAMALKKPTLYLYQRGTVAKILSHLSLKELPNWIRLVSYQDRSLERQIEDFLQATGGKAIKPAPRIKFTLRVTSLIEDFLRFKTVNTKTSKADWVRNWLEQVMAEDEDWQKHLRRRRDGAE